MSGFGEGVEYDHSSLGKCLCIPRELIDGSLSCVPLPQRPRLGDVPNAGPLLALDREHRPWLRHQHEVAIDVHRRITVPVDARLRPISICAPGGVPFQLNATASSWTFVAETAIIQRSSHLTPGTRVLTALHPPSLSARLHGVARWLAPPKARSVVLAKRSIRRSVFSKVSPYPSPPPLRPSPLARKAPHSVREPIVNLGGPSLPSLPFPPLPPLPSPESLTDYCLPRHRLQR